MFKKNKINLYIGINTNHHLKGGGFNFLDFLSYRLNKKKIISKSFLDANIILVNSHHNFLKIIFYKFFFPKKVFIHRIDGPISKYVGKEDFRDYLVQVLNKYVADATIFQSNWSYNKNKFMTTKEKIIIHNMADQRFYKYKKEKKIKNSIIICSWSNNINKGYKYYSFLDNNLDFKKFHISFIGNSPIEFKNIKNYNFLNSNQLSKLMRKHMIYLTASKNDPCSNSLLEALSLKLPALTLKSGGHPEILEKKGICFKNKNDLIIKINYIFNNYKKFLNKLNNPIEDRVNEYLNYFSVILEKSNQKKLVCKKIKVFTLLQILFLYLSKKIHFIYKN